MIFLFHFQSKVQSLHFNKFTFLPLRFQQWIDLCAGDE